MITVIILLSAVIVMAIASYMASEYKKYKEALEQFKLFTPKAKVLDTDYNFFAISREKGIVWIENPTNAFLNPYVEPVKQPGVYFCCSDVEKEMLVILNKYNKKKIFSIINKTPIYL